MRMLRSIVAVLLIACAAMLMQASRCRAATDKLAPTSMFRQEKDADTAADLQNMEKICKLFPGNIPSIVAYVDACLTLKRVDLLPVASAFLDEGLRVHPSDPELLEWKATLFHSSGHPYDAIHTIKTILAEHPDRVSSILLLFNLQVKFGDYADAIQTASWGLYVSRDPDLSSGYLRMMARLFEIVGFKDDAALAKKLAAIPPFTQAEARDYLHQLRRTPINPAEDMAVIEKAQDLGAKGKFSEAISMYRSLSKTTSQDPAVWYALAKALLHYAPIAAAQIEGIPRRDRENPAMEMCLAEARDAIAEGLHLAPDYPDLWVALATLYFRQNRQEEAMASVRHALSLDGKNKEGLFLLLSLQTKIKSAEDALHTANRLASLVENPVEWRSLMEQIAMLYPRTSLQSQTAEMLAPHFPQSAAELDQALHALGMGEYPSNEKTRQGLKTQDVVEMAL